MTVIPTVDAEHFEEWIKPTRSTLMAVSSIFEDLEIAEGGFLHGESDNLEVIGWKGTTLISLNLLASDAASCSDPLIELASTIAAKIE